MSVAVRKALPPSRLSLILKNLNREPRLVLPDVTTLRIKLALKDDHFGARHFVKEELPRIRWANPELGIAVERVPKPMTDKWDAELEVSFKDGHSHTFNLSEKWSTTIVRELMDKAGGPLWEQWKAQALEAGTPVVPGEETAHQPVAKQLRHPKPPAAWKLLRTKNLAEGGGQDTVPEEAMEAAEEEAQRVKQLSGPGAVFRPAEKPKTLRGEVSSSS